MNFFIFFNACARRKHVLSTDKTAQSGSRKFPSDDEEIICDYNQLNYMSKLLDGKKVSELLAKGLAIKVRKLKNKPKLAIIQVGDLEESNTYIKKKLAFAKKIGVIAIHKKYPKNARENEIISDILKYNADVSVHGVMIQLPLSKGFNKNNILESISSKKDVDGLTAKNTKLLFDNSEAFVPATTKGILSLFEYYKINLTGKKAIIVGQSSLVGKPTALAFLNRKATVTVCNIHTKNLEKETKSADILVVAAGHPNLITKKHVHKNQIVIDVGINILPNGKITGDADYKNIKSLVRAITPVPGGAGPMTVVSLFQNLLKAYFGAKKS